MNEIIEETYLNRETSKFRFLFLPYCKGEGVDIGYGLDPIVRTAIRIDDTRSWYPPFDGSMEYREINGLQLLGDCRNLKWFKDECMDYVYSSHVLEDFEDKESVIREWLRILKPGGYLCLLLPDEKRYREIEQIRNSEHKDENFCLDSALKILNNFNLKIIKSWNRLPWPGGDYNFGIVAQK